MKRRMAIRIHSKLYENCKNHFIAEFDCAYVKHPMEMFLKYMNDHRGSKKKLYLKIRKDFINYLALYEGADVSIDDYFDYKPKFTIEFWNTLKQLTYDYEVRSCDIVNTSLFMLEKMSLEELQQLGDYKPPRIMYLSLEPDVAATFKHYTDERMIEYINKVLRKVGRLG